MVRQGHANSLVERFRVETAALSEVVRLRHRLENQARIIVAQSAEIDRLKIAAFLPGAELGPIGPIRGLGLTKRHVVILRLISLGRSNREIAADLILSEQTVRNYVRVILRELGVATRTQAALLARDLDLT